MYPRSGRSRLLGTLRILLILSRPYPGSFHAEEPGEWSKGVQLSPQETVFLARFLVVAVACLCCVIATCHPSWRARSMFGVHVPSVSTLVHVRLDRHGMGRAVLLPRA